MVDRFSRDSIKIAAIAIGTYLAWHYFVVGLRSDHLFLISALSILFFATSTTRSLVKGFIFFILYSIIYDSMRIYPNFQVNPVHILEPYLFEKSWFGIGFGENRLTPNEWFIKNQHPVFDFAAGAFYLTWVPLPIAFAFWLFRNNTELLIRFSAAFLFTNLVGFIIYYSYPAAPPWYYAQYGNIESFDILGSAALLQNFDEIIGVPLYSNMYTKNANVFAAIPSLHGAYPIVLTYYGFKARLKYLKWLFAITIPGIWFGAVYSNHHYLLDLILGAFCALLGIFLFERFLYPSKVGKRLKAYAASI